VGQRTGGGAGNWMKNLLDHGKGRWRQSCLLVSAGRNIDVHICSSTPARCTLRELNTHQDSAIELALPLEPDKVQPSQCRQWLESIQNPTSDYIPG